MIKLCTHFILFDIHINNRDVFIGNAKKAYYPVSMCFLFYITFDKIKKIHLYHKFNLTRTS